MTIRIQCVCIDAVRPGRLATFWQEALGWRRTVDTADQVVLEPPAGSPEDGVVPDLLFLRVDQPKTSATGKNRVHLDLRPLDRDAEVLRLESLGASRADIGQGPDVGWVVMTDPEGNEFCVLAPLPDDALADAALADAVLTDAALTDAVQPDAALNAGDEQAQTS